MGSTERLDWLNPPEKSESIGEKLSREAHLWMSLKDNFVPEITGRSKYYDWEKSDRDPFDLDDGYGASLFLRGGILSAGGMLGLCLRFKGAAPMVAAVAAAGVALDVLGRAAPIMIDDWNHKSHQYDNEHRLAQQVVQSVEDVGFLAGGIAGGYAMGTMVKFETSPPGPLVGGAGETMLPIGFPIVHI